MTVREWGGPVAIGRFDGLRDCFYVGDITFLGVELEEKREIMQ